MVDGVVGLAVVHRVNHRSPLGPPLALSQVLSVTKGRHVFKIEFDLTNKVHLDPICVIELFDFNQRIDKAEDREAGSSSSSSRILGM